MPSLFINNIIYLLIKQNDPNKTKEFFEKNPEEIYFDYVIPKNTKIIKDLKKSIEKTYEQNYLRCINFEYHTLQEEKLCLKNFLNNSWKTSSCAKNKWKKYESLKEIREGRKKHQESKKNIDYLNENEKINNENT